MGACCSKSTGGEKEVQAVPPQVGGEESLGTANVQEEHVQMQRRRLSLSQCAEAPANEEERGHVEASPQLVRQLSPTRELKEPSSDGKAHRERRRLSISGVLSTSQSAYDNKAHELAGGANTVDALRQMGIGFACKKGLKPESPNQDDFFISRTEASGLYGVFDGHGPDGHDVSNFVQSQLPKLLQQHPLFATDVAKAMKDSFHQVHDKLEKGDYTGRMDPSLSGTTATLILHQPIHGTPENPSKLYVAHVGDSRAVLGKASGPALARIREGVEPGSVRAMDLTNDHKPNNEKEKARIHKMGGVVRRLEGDIPHRVFVKGRMYPGLAMSRAIGDTVGTQAGIIPEPEVTEYELDVEQDVFMIAASDGVWEFIESKEAVDAVAAYGMDRVQEAAEAIAKEAWDRWIEEEGSVVDDITIEIIFLHPSILR